MTTSLWFFSLAQFLLLVIVGWVMGDWLIRIVAARRNGPDDPDGGGLEIDWPERALMSVLGFVIFAVGCMVLNIALGGVVLGVPGVVLLLGTALVIFRWKNLRWPASIPWKSVALLAVPLVLLWMLPVFVSGTAARTGDIPWHLGWTNQLLEGQPMPQGPAPTEVAANAYPWGFHALLATLVRIVPGSDVLSGLIALQLMMVLAVPLGAACLARRVVDAAGWAAAAATGFVGGFGWILLRSPAFATSPAEAMHGADLVAASPNSVYELLPPPLPREFGLVLLALAGVGLSIGYERGRRGPLVLAGVALGAAGLISVPALVAGLVWTLAMVLVSERGRRARLAAQVLVPAAAIFALWAGPVVRHLILHGGFVNVSPTLGREWPLWTSLGAWGLLGPLAALGVLVARRQPQWRTMAAFGVATAGLLMLAVARGEFDWELAGNATVLHQGRIWPVAHLLGGAFAGVALWRLVDRMRARSWRAAVCVPLLVAGAASPALASASLSETMREAGDGFPFSTPDLAEKSFVRRTADYLGPDDTLRVEGPPEHAQRLAFHVFSFSGVRLTEFDDPRLEENDLRIRYEDLAQEWNRTIESGGYEADYVIYPKGDDFEGGVVAVGSFDGLSWVLVKITTSSDL